MAAIKQQALAEFFDRYGRRRGISTLVERWRRAKTEQSAEEIGNALVELYESATSFVEEELDKSGYPEATLELYHRLFRELESQMAYTSSKKRHDFVVVIPVADRPKQLENCLNSLLQLCQKFNYGGMLNGKYGKVSVLVADDSKNPENISHHKKISDFFCRQGLKTRYFGQAEQLRQLDRLTEQRKDKLHRIIGNNPATIFYHKGASITRNISYLKLKQLTGDNDRRLFWFIDSDQEFRSNSGNDDRNVYVINYFHRLNQIFSTTETLVLTGKVVGDPPVSPAVMAGNLLEDVIGFLSDLAKQDPRQACQFHGRGIQKADDASYHDMADLFGFKPATSSSHYHCRLNAPHDHAACFAGFSEKLNRFFDGEHPTRWTSYEYEHFPSSIEPARTVYTGNYVFRPEALQYFIPFARLKLRMAGPVLGRILQSEKGRKFVSANLPMLHKRTVDTIGQSEFRPGIDRENDRIDLSGEFERQFYGDVMLFTIESLTKQGYPLETVSEQRVRETLTRVEAGLQRKYSDTHAQIQGRIEDFKSCFSDPKNWWCQTPDSQPANANFRRFITNMELNFGKVSPAHRMIQSDSHRNRRCSEILDAIMKLPQDRAIWQETLSTGP